MDSLKSCKEHFKRGDAQNTSMTIIVNCNCYIAQISAWVEEREG